MCLYLIHALEWAERHTGELARHTGEFACRLRMGRRDHVLNETRSELLTLKSRVREMARSQLALNHSGGEFTRTNEEWNMLTAEYRSALEYLARC